MKLRNRSEYENISEPGSPPENIQAIIDPDNRVTISWQEPKYPNGPIVVRVVSYCKKILSHSKIPFEYL